MLMTTLVVSPAFAGGATRQPDGRVRAGFAGPFAGNNIYNLTAARQKAKIPHWQPALPGAKQYAFHISIQNDGTRRDRFKVSAPGAASTNGWRVTYWVTVAGAQDLLEVTSDVRAGTFRTPRLGSGAKYSITVEVATLDAEDAGDIQRKVTITSVGDPTQKDAVKVIVKEKFCTC
jgi:hypothetical protein